MTMPMPATIITVTLATGSGLTSRRIASQAMAPTATSRSTALKSAATIEEPPRP